MKKTTRAGLLATTLLVALAGSRISAQDTMAVVESVTGPSALLEIDRSGVIVGSVTIPSPNSEAPLSVVTGPGDDSITVLMSPSGSSSRALRVTRTGWSELHRFPFPVMRMDYDDAGDLIGLVDQPSGIFRLTGGTPTRIVDLPRFFASDFTVDRVTGDWIVMAGNGTLFRVDRSTSAITSIGAFLTPSRNVLFDLDTNAVFGTGPQIGRFDLTGGQGSTLTSLAGSLSITAITFDPTTRGIAFLGHDVGRFIVFGLVDRDGSQTGVIQTERYTVPNGLALRYGRPFVAQSAPARGATYRVRFGAPLEANRSYVAAISFTHTPGIDTPAGKVPLGVDALFAASLGGAFRGMSGTLDGFGQASIEVDIPAIAGLEHLPLHLAAVTLENGGIQSIYGPHSFVVR